MLNFLRSKLRLIATTALTVIALAVGLVVLSVVTYRVPALPEPPLIHIPDRR